MTSMIECGWCSAEVDEDDRASVMEHGPLTCNTQRISLLRQMAEQGDAQHREYAESVLPVIGMIIDGTITTTGGMMSNLNTIHETLDDLTYWLSEPASPVAQNTLDYLANNTGFRFGETPGQYLRLDDTQAVVVARIQGDAMQGGKPVQVITGYMVILAQIDQEPVTETVHDPENDITITRPSFFVTKDGTKRYHRNVYTGLRYLRLDGNRLQDALEVVRRFDSARRRDRLGEGLSELTGEGASVDQQVDMSSL